MPVNSSHMQLGAMESRWLRCRDCYDGNDTVKARGEKYLPLLAFHKLDRAKYEEYKLRAVFYNAMARTADGLAGAVHQKAPNVKLPGNISEDFMRDVTLAGEDAAMFSLGATREVLIAARYGILVDMPPDEETSGVAVRENRPYMRGYFAEDIINWRTETRGGDKVLTLLVLREMISRPKSDDPFTEDSVTTYRVFELVGQGELQGARVTVYEEKPPEQGAQNKGPEFVVISQAVLTRRGKPVPFIPFVFVNPTSNGPDLEKPPLDDLCELNLSHYRNSADHEHGMHWTALPTPWVSGTFDKDTGTLEIGSSKAWKLQQGGQCGMLEFNGTGLGAIVIAMDRKQKMMATLGARLLEDGGGPAETATAINMRHSGEHATLKTIAGSVSKAMTIALRWCSWWMGTEEQPESIDAEFTLNTDFFATKMSSNDLQAAVAALQAETISYKTFYYMLQRGDMARPNVTVEEEQKEIEDSKAATKDIEAEGGIDDELEPDPDDPENPENLDPKSPEAMAAAAAAAAAASKAATKPGAANPAKIAKPKP
jgi:hypothetical protein